MTYLTCQNTRRLNHSTPSDVRVPLWRGILLAIVVLCAMLVGQRYAYAQEMQEDSGVIEDFPAKLAKWFPVSVSSSTDVRERIAKLPQAEKKRIAAAARKGAEFLQQYLDEFACMTDYPDWDSQIMPFVEDRDKITQTCENIKPQEISDQGGKYHLLRELCSNPSLVDFNVGIGTVSLTYQVAILGVTKFGKLADQDQIAFEPEESGAKERIVIVIGQDNKVFTFNSIGGTYERVYSKTLGEVDVDRKSPYVIPSNADTGWINRIERYRQMARQIRPQAAAVCR